MGGCTVVSETEGARGSQPETDLLFGAGVQLVAHEIVESHDSKFIERAPGATTPCSGYSHQLRCLLNQWEITDNLPCPGLLSSPYRKFCPCTGCIVFFGVVPLKLIGTTRTPVSSNQWGNQAV